MKAALGIFAGFLVSLGMFCFGVVFATSLLKVDAPRELGQTQDVTDLWTNRPQKPATGTQYLTRLPPSQVPPSSVDAPDKPVVDLTTTASVSTEVEKPIGSTSILHVEWCHSRYRSYREEDNYYTSYSGFLRPCVSPFSRKSLDTQDLTEAAVGNDLVLTANHISDCFRRYRSYSPDDNSYQPHGGGPRRQCR